MHACTPASKPHELSRPVKKIRGSFAGRTRLVSPGRRTVFLQGQGIPDAIACLRIGKSPAPEFVGRISSMSVDVPREPSEQVLDILKRADGVCFDVDSTFCKDESIDELAEYLGVGEEVKNLTAKAMGGTVLFQDALAERLGVMSPSRADVDNFLRDHPHMLSDGIQELLDILNDKGVKVFLVSGGFRQIIHPLAESLGIPVAHVFANNLLFDDSGAYSGFDAEEFTSRSGGKKEAVMHIKENWGLKTVVMVGDGATDAEAKAPSGADIFIGYGGTVFREGVAKRSDWYVMDIKEIRDKLD